jgi:hypothetical protein
MGGILSILQIVLPLLGGVLNMLMKSNAPAEIIAGVNNAITELTKVHGTLVTKAQVDSLLDTPQW